MVGAGAWTPLNPCRNRMMNARLKYFFAGLTGFSMTIAAGLAQTEDRAPSDRRPVGVMAALDRNGNGVIEAEEIDLAVVSLRKLDRNKDGRITREEISGSGPARPSRGRPPLLSTLDKDGDGKVSKEEAPERLKERFDRIDSNGDGYIDAEEEKVARQRFRGPQGPDRRPGGQRPADGEGGAEKPK